METYSKCSVRIDVERCLVHQSCKPALSLEARIYVYSFLVSVLKRAMLFACYLSAFYSVGVMAAVWVMLAEELLVTCSLPVRNMYWISFSFHQAHPR